MRALPFIAGLLLFAGIPLLGTGTEPVALAAEPNAPTVKPTAKKAPAALEESTTIGRATILVSAKPARETGSWGYTIRRASLKDRFGNLVGRSHLLCFLIRKGERNCHGTYVFPRGHIMVSGLVQANSYTLAVIGGTGLYDNARGAVRISPSGPNLRVFFQLVG